MKHEVRLRWGRPHTLAEMNPKGIPMFKHRICIGCRKPIMKHWILPFSDPQRRAEQYCYRDGMSKSTGMVYS